ncbi:DUF2092 domain-containing protein [Acuticoccus sediminis]|uniref:DUF2092 domain-containing protein n=1 Tax=Acuticoccus sediminis TaxID=2184697 RepID=UPI001CFD2230|nr:DUF2092 domain-containing protein [Acuticoccus sediminis]
MEQALQTRQDYDLHGIHFDSDKAVIQPQSGPLLDDVATVLESFPDWTLRIVGHTDASGDAGHNQALSLQRAEAVRSALVERGIDAGRLEAAGVGADRPVAANETAEGRELNRRVELMRVSDSPAARELLKAMSDYLAAQDRLAFDFDATLEVVTEAGQKLGLASSGTVSLERPDHVRATRAGGFLDLEMLFDGTTLTLVGQNANAYTQVELPGSLDQLVDTLRDRFGRPLPAADLLLSDPYDALMSEVYDVKDLGSGVVGGAECDWLAFRTDEVDWQIWIAQGDRPLPCRYAITTKHMAHAPQYTIEFRDWRTGDAVAPDRFDFAAASGAQKVDPAALREKVAELPANFMTRSAQ